MNQPSPPAIDIDLSIQLGRLALPNPITVASGTFGYAREMESFVDLSRLGGVIPKTVTPQLAKATIHGEPLRHAVGCSTPLD